MNLLRQKSLAMVAPLVGVTAVSGFLLASRPVSAETASASVTVRSACTFSAVVDIAHTATINPGTYQDDIGKTTFSVTCNDAGGYSIYAIGYGNQEYGNTKLLANIGGTLTPSYDINTGTNTSGTSAWAMKLTPRTNLTASNIVNGYGSYSVVPTTYTKVATMVPTTTIPNPTSLETTYRVNIASSQPAGTYNGKVRYTMVNPATELPLQPRTPTQGCISYFPNAHGVTDTMGDQCLSSGASSATLWATNFINTGYGFAGWSDAFDYVANFGSESNPNAHIYGPNENIADSTIISGIKTNGLSLYAVWVPAESNMQNWTGCSAMNQGEVIALTDLRDNDAYAVAKLADGNCWMIENMRLDYEATRGDSNKALSQGYATSTTYGNFIGLADPEVANFTDSTTANSIYYSGTQSGTASVNINTTNYPDYRFPRYRNDNTNSDATKNPNTTTTNMTGTDQNVYGYGNYYTWAAAMANTIYYSGPTAQDTDGKTSETVKTSICPAGWKLPYGRNTGNGALSGGFSYLDIQLGGTGASQSTSAASLRWRTYPNNFLYSGEAYNSSVGSRGNYGYYWSSTADDNRGSYSLRLHSSHAYPGTNFYYRYVGISVRCVAGV